MSVVSKLCATSPEGAVVNTEVPQDVLSGLYFLLLPGAVIFNHAILTRIDGAQVRWEEESAMKEGHHDTLSLGTAVM